MKFEVLPNEILIQCFQYLNAPYLFYSFDQLNYRFNDLIRHIRLCINLKEDLSKSIFDKFCTKMSSNPGIKDQVYSLNLPSLKDNDPAGLRTKVFLSFFSLEDFSNLRNFKINADIRFRSTNMVSFDFNDKHMLEFSRVPFSQLRALSISKLYGRSASLKNIRLTITNLTVAICDFDDFYLLSTDAPMLKCLHVIQFSRSAHFPNMNKSQCFLQLKKLIIDDFIYISLNDFEIFLKFTPNLKQLKISANGKDLINEARWKQLITTSLPSLSTFQFMFSCSRYKVKLSTMIPKLEEFQSDFWRKEHRWFTEYTIADDSICIHTIPYAFKKYELKSNSERHHNDLKSNSGTFDNVTNLVLNCKIRKKKCEYYFSNVTSLKLDGYSNSLTIEQIGRLRRIFNPFHLKYLGLSRMRGMDSSLLLKLLEKMPQLSILSVWQDDLINYIHDSKLCEQLKKMVKRLYVEGREDYDLFKRDQFYEVFRNIEHFQFEASDREDLFFSLSCLPKLSTLQAKWVAVDDPKWYIPRIQNELNKQNVIYDIKAGEYRTEYDDNALSYDPFAEIYYNRRLRVECYDVKICLWRDIDITSSNCFETS